MPMEYIVPSLRIAATTRMDDGKTLEEQLDQLAQLKEDLFIVGFHQHIQNDKQNAWHDIHIKNK